MSPKMQEILKQFKLNIAGLEGFDLPREIGGGVGLRFNMFTKGGPSVEVIVRADGNYSIVDGAGEGLHYGEWSDYVDTSVDVEDIDFGPLVRHIRQHYRDYVEDGEMPRFDESAPKFLRRMKRTK